MRRLPILRSLQNLEIEEKILNIGALIAMVGVFLPWFGGTWFGEPKMWSGFGFYTSFVGLLIFLAYVCTISLTVLPLLGYSVMKTSVRDLVRFVVGMESVVLVVMVLSIFTKISFDFSQMQTRFGVYVTLVGSIVVSLYSFLRIQQRRKHSVEQLFHHPEDDIRLSPRESPKPKVVAELVPPPPSPEPEKARLF